MLSFTDIALRRGPTKLFENVTFTLNAREKLGLIGANGAGKTSLFKLILGELESDQGDCVLAPGTRIAHLAQEVPASTQKAHDYVLGGDAEFAQITAALELAEAEEDFVRLAPLHEALGNIDGYSAKARASQLMAGLGFKQHEFEQTLASFSGGWRIRLNLARTLMTRSDLLLLDEPTNHLDLDAVVWLAGWIKRYPGAMLLISHDREFLDETVDGIASLERRTIEVFSGNYSRFELTKAARLAQQQSLYLRQQQEIEHMEAFVRRFRAKATKARQAQSRVKALERMTRIAPAHVDSPFHFQIPISERLSDPLLSLKQAQLGYANVVLDKVRVELHPGDRIGLLGHNGAGKSTLMKTLSGELALLGGERVAGANLKMGYFSQHQVDDLDLQASALTHIARIDAATTEQQARNFLGGFDFRDDKVKCPVSLFSGGEKARLALALIAFKRPNLLLLDEPTNHLDIEMRQALTVALQDFGGAIVLISHDRHLLANTVDAFFLVADGAVGSFEGDLEDYRAGLLRQSEEPANVKEKSKQSRIKAQNNQKRERQQIRSRLTAVEKRLERLQRKLAEVETVLGDVSLYQADDPGDLQKYVRERVNLREEIETLEQEWFDLSEKEPTD